MKHTDSNNIISPFQHGFRAKYSCESQLTSFIQELVPDLEKGSEFDLAIMDFSKAFDKVPHKRLIDKLNYYGIRNNTLNWIALFLSARTQTVVLDGERSTPASVVSGVPRGTVLYCFCYLFMTFPSG